MYDGRRAQKVANASRLALKTAVSKSKKGVTEAIRKGAQGTAVFASRTKSGTMKMLQKCFKSNGAESQEDMKTDQEAMAALRSNDSADNVALVVEDSFSDLIISDKEFVNTCKLVADQENDVLRDKTAVITVIEHADCTGNEESLSVNFPKDINVFCDEDEKDLCVAESSDADALRTDSLSSENHDTSFTIEKSHVINDRGSLPLLATDSVGERPSKTTTVAPVLEKHTLQIKTPIQGNQLQIDSGDHIGEFVVQQELGRGHFSTVFKVMNTDTSMTFAAKIMPVNLDDDNIRRGYDFHREAAIHSSLQNIHVVAFRGFEVRGGLGLLLMEFIDGPTLHTYVRDEEYLEEEEARDLFKQVASTVRYCHRSGIYHRDIKLENILITKWKSIRLCDFDLAALDEGGGRVFGSSGTRPYSAPEVFCNGESGYDGAKADVFSLGVVLFVMTHGWIPFGRERGEDGTIAADGEIPFADEVTDDLRQLLVRMLSSNAVERASLDEVMRHPWYVSE